MAKEKEIPQLLGRADLMRRWGITKEGTLWRSRNHKDFPQPVQFIHNGRTALYKLSDVERYEKNHEQNNILQTEKGN